ncbi:Dps family protein [Lewinella sp. IMCC34183]|uniref:Dps family protein n=1 Tax=Lewinella sp. IMCC34183 TaxID=2248762 RepID=UPI000E228175|nr:DNA starvation/stationary phase protection protein [Lewinella sp. IMCC34183]
MKSLLFSLLLLPVVGFAQQSFSTDYRSPTGADRVPRAETDIPPTTDALQATLVELTDQYYAVHQLHWNITGPLFISLHELYEEFYEGLSGTIDEVAERKLALDQPADNRPATVVSDSPLSPATPAGFVSDKRSLEILAERYEQLSNNVARRITETGETDPVTQDLLISVKDMLDLHLWKVRSFLK